MHSNKQLSEKPYCDWIYFSKGMEELVMNVSLKFLLIINVYPCLNKYTATLQASKQFWEIVFNPSQVTQKSHWGFITHYLVKPWINKPGDLETMATRSKTGEAASVWRTTLEGMHSLPGFWSPPCLTWPCLGHSSFLCRLSTGTGSWNGLRGFNWSSPLLAGILLSFHTWGKWDQSLQVACPRSQN